MLVGVDHEPAQQKKDDDGLLSKAEYEIEWPTIEPAEEVMDNDIECGAEPNGIDGNRQLRQ